MKCKLNEYQYEVYKTFLMENQESDSQKKAIKYVMDNLDYDKEDAEKYVRVTLRDKLRILTNNRKVGKFTLGALRLYIEDCKSEKDVRTLYNILNTISENKDLIDKYDKNFDNKSLSQLSNEIKHEIKPYEEPPYDSSKLNANYKIYKIDSFEDAHKFSDFVSWCITKNANTLESYNDNYKSQFYIAVVKGFEDMNESDHFKEDLLGEYGLSMLAICVTPFGELKSCTCRWNHGKGGDDHCMNVEEIQKVVGVNFKEAFPPNNNGKQFIELYDEIEQNLYSLGYHNFIQYMNNNPQKIKELKISHRRLFEPDLYVVNLGKLYNYVFDKTGEKCLFKCKSEITLNNDHFIAFTHSVLYYDSKLDNYLFYDVENNKISKLPEFKGIKNLTHINGDAYSNSFEHLVVLETKDNCRLYGDNMNQMLNFKNEVKEFKQILSVSPTETNDGETLSIIDILYEDEKGLPRNMVYDAYQDEMYYDCDFLDGYGQSFYTIRIKGNYKGDAFLNVIIDSKRYEGICNCDVELPVEGGLINKRFAFLYKGESLSKSNILIYDLYKNKLIGEYKNIKTFDFGYDNQFYLLAYTKDGEIYNFDVYEQNDGDSELSYSEENVKFHSFASNYDIEFAYFDSNDKLFFMGKYGNVIDFEEFKNNILNEKEDLARNFYADIFNKSENRFREFTNFEDFVKKVNPLSNDFYDEFDDMGFDLAEYMKYRWMEKISKL